LRRIKITLAYDGTAYHGWQVQPGLATIQGTLEEVMAGIEGKPVAVHGSGRTDAGVHALAQVAAFSMENPIPPLNLKRAMNRLLPPSIRIREVEEAAPGFEPRFDARSKVYEYRIFRSEVCSPFERPYVHHFPYRLDVERLCAAAPLFEGEHDFSAFAASDDSDALGRTKVRTIFSSRVEVMPERLFYRVRGSGFLKHMVRNIVGTLIQAGKGRVSGEAIRAMLEPGAAGRGGPTAPPMGLFLVEVEY
jgi:tRNA pseudouridine38-40 synthase